MSDIKVRTLGNQVTVYDNNGNVINQIPPPPSVPPKVKYVNIIEIEDRIMGIDSTSKPDFFLDFENDERFMDIEKNPRFNSPLKIINRNSIIDMICLLLFGITSFTFGCTAF